MKKVLGTVGFVGLLGAGVVSGMGAGCPDKKECKGLVERVLETYTEKKPLTIAWFKKEFDVKDDDATKRLRSQLKVNDLQVITDEVAKNITFTGKNKVTEGKEAVVITATYDKKDVGIYVKEDAAPLDVKTVRDDLAKYKKKEDALEVKGIGGKTAKDATATILAALQAVDPKFPPTVVFSSSEKKLQEGAPTAIQATCKGDVTDFFVKAVPA